MQLRVCSNRTERYTGCNAQNPEAYGNPLTDDELISLCFPTSRVAQRRMLVFRDVGPIGAAAKERVGYPTQKPLALLDRIIKVSSNAGGLVLARP